jgi:hypothetical protein
VCITSNGLTWLLSSRVATVILGAINLLNKTHAKQKIAGSNF